MAFFPSTLEKVTCPVYTCTVTYSGQVTFYKVPENTAIFNCHSVFYISQYNFLKIPMHAGLDPDTNKFMQEFRDRFIREIIIGRQQKQSPIKVTEQVIYNILIDRTHIKYRSVFIADHYHCQKVKRCTF